MTLKIPDGSEIQNLINESVNKIEAFLPNIRPLQNFIHLNIYPDLINRDFWETLEITSRLYGHIPFLPMEFYQNLFKQNQIEKSDIELAIKLLTPPDHFTLNSDDFIFREKKDYSFPEKSYRPIHKNISELIKHSLNELTEPLVVRILSSYFDQGVSFWAAPHSQNHHLLDFFLLLCTESYLPLFPVKSNFAKGLIGKSHLEIIENLSQKLFSNTEILPLYYEECLLSLRGWAGFIKTINRRKDLLIEKRNATNLDLLCIRMIIEYSWLNYLKPNILPLDIDKNNLSLNLTKTSLMNENEFWAFKIWHYAYELNTYRKSFSAIRNNFRPKLAKKIDTIDSNRIFCFFCIDDREAMLRAKIENLSSDIITFGTPGHFGLDFFYKSSSNSHPKKSCPDPIAAPFIVLSQDKIKNERIFRWQKHGQNLIKDFVMTIYDGIKSSFELFDLVFQKKIKNGISPIKIKRPEKLKIFHDEEGYQFDQAAMRIHSLLTSINVINHFPEIIFIIGHGSTTTNNPYFQAYGCGACSGRSGDINAQVFCEMANHDEVRKILQYKYNLNLPKLTKFIPAFHDTCQDVMTIMIDGDWRNHPQVMKFIDICSDALIQCAFTRTKDFEIRPAQLKPLAAHSYLRNRSRAIFEPRPELGHSKNFICYIGNRDHIRELNFDRRAFLQSYDSSVDPNGEILLGLLHAAVPVCGGINLDYYFARTNNYFVGAGSKLSHNITGLIGLSNGTEDDLLTGLAYQMCELHEPIRLTFIIEQKIEILEKLIKENDLLNNWFNNQWVNLASLDLENNTLLYRHQGQWQSIEGEVHE